MTRLIFAGIAAFFVATGCRQAEAPPPAPASAPAVSTAGDVQTRLGVLNFERGFPTAETTRKLFDELDYQRAVQAYLWAYPAVSFESIRLAAKRDLMDPTTSISCIADNFADPQIDLSHGQRHHHLCLLQRRSRQGRARRRRCPARAIVGLIDDFWQRSITDVGLPGPDGDKGGKFLLLPPGYTGDVPKHGYHVLQATMNNYNIMVRGIVTNMDGDVPNAVQTREEVADLSVERTQQSRSRTNSCPFRAWQIDTLPPAGLEYWARLSAFINNNPVEERDRFFMAMLKPLGIEKGKPFKPDARQRAILEEAARLGDAMGAHDALRRRSSASPAPSPFGGTNWNWVVLVNPDQETDTLQPARRAAALHLRRHLHFAQHRRQEGRARDRSMSRPSRTRMATTSTAPSLTACTCRRTCRPRPSGRSRFTTRRPVRWSRTRAMTRPALVLRQAQDQRRWLGRSLLRPQGARGVRRATGSRRFPARASTRCCASTAPKRGCSTGHGSCRTSS